MTNEMMTEMNGDEDAPPARTHELEVAAAYFRRSSALMDAASMADHLVERKPDVMSALEQKRIDDVVRLRKQAYAVLLRDAKVSTAAMLPARLAELGGASRVNRMLGVRMESSDPEIAREASEVRAAVFGTVRDLKRFKPRALWTTMNAVVEKLETNPALRERLEALVTESVVQEMLVAHQLYGKALGPLRPKAVEVPEPDVRLLTSRLDQRIERYVASVLAATDPDDPESERRAESALRPILEARDVDARRRARGEASAAEEEAEEVDASTDADEPEAEIDVAGANND